MGESVLHEVKELKRKAEQNRQMHLRISHRANLGNKCMHAIILIGSALIAVLTFADYSTFKPIFPTLTDGVYKLTIGLFAGLVFTMTILEEYFRLGEKVASHESVGKQLTSFIRRASALEVKNGLSEVDLEVLVNDYSGIHENSPVISDKIFLKEKQRLLIKIEISKELSRNPHMSVILYRLKRKFKKNNAT